MITLVTAKVAQYNGVANIHFGYFAVFFIICDI